MESVAPESRVLAMASCLKDARDAYKHAEIEPTPEDIRTVAISFFIDMNKNSRMDRMEKTESKPVTQPTHYNTQPVTVQGNGYSSTPPSTGNLGNCPKCGAVMRMSKQGKPYCSATCWKK